MSEEPFGFEVSVDPVVDHSEVSDMVRDEWSVALPHQCDSWVVGAGSKAEVADALRAFIAEATEALATLERTRPCLHEWHDEDRQHRNNAGTQRFYRCARCGRAVWMTVDRSTAAPWYYAETQESPATRA